MSWQHRVRPVPGTPPLRDVQAAAQNLAEQVGLAPGKARVVFQTIADVALVGTVLVSGALAGVHLWKALFPKHKANQDGPDPAAGGRLPPRRPGHQPTFAAGGHSGDEEARWAR